MDCEIEKQSNNVGDCHWEAIKDTRYESTLQPARASDRTSPQIKENDNGRLIASTCHADWIAALNGDLGPGMDHLSFALRL